MKLKNLKKITLLTVLVIVFAQKASSQQNLIEFLDKSTLSLTPEQNLKLKKAQDSDFREDVEVITVNSLEKSIFENTLNLRLPDYNCNFKFQYRSSKHKNESNYSWYGELQGNSNTECEIGSILYIKNGERTHGQLEIGNDVYEFIDIERGKHLFYKYTEKAFGGFCGTTGSEIKHNDSQKNIIDSNIQSGCPEAGVINVLVLYTPSAHNAALNIGAVANMSMQQLEISLNNSAVNTAKLNVNLVDVLPYSFTETNNINDDIGNFAGELAAQSLRQANEADLVVLLTDGSYDFYYGVVDEIGPSFAGAYSIVQVNQATSYKTFAHEVGHLFGGRHDIDTDGTIEHGYTFKKWFLGIKRGTILATLGSINGDSDRRIMHFSNPEVEWENQPTGTYSTNDNETHFENNGLTIAEFFPNNLPPFSGEITGPNQVCASNPSVLLQSSLTCGEAPFTYHWEVTENGINWQTIGFNQNVFYTPQGSFQPSTTVTFRLTATDADNNTVVRSHNLTFVELLPGFECADDFHAKPLEVTVYPNPISSTSQVNIKLKKQDVANVQLFSISGIKVLETTLNGKNLIIPIGNLNLKQGVYYLRVTNQKGQVEGVSLQIRD